MIFFKNLTPIFLLVLIFFFQGTLAQTPIVGRGTSAKPSAPKAGKEAAQEYFKSDVEKAKDKESVTFSKSIESGDHYLALGVGNHLQGDAWSWGQREKQKNTGASSANITYRYSEWGQTDLNIRFDFNEFNVTDEKLLKMSILPVIIFPEASSKFPLYFGAGAGLGIFFKQLKDESNISFDYQLFLGARFFNVYGSSGFFLETGLKNHLHLTSDGQFNGTYFSVGAVFTF
ncbi:MAG: hypothetical protein J0M15_06820 [Deltaproteobacteria bacterium]|jgi:hypothetical protein|nr:hypothetical protein [Deltaproteobacteria bacterium]